MEQRIDKKSFTPEVVVLYCQHCLAKDVEVKAENSHTSGFKARFFVMPCSSKIEASHVLKILSEGADAVEVIGCKPDHCRFLIGSTMVEKRLEHAKHLLNEAFVGAERLGMERGEELSSIELESILENRAEAVRPLGPNPMKKEEVQ